MCDLQKILTIDNTNELVGTKEEFTPIKTYIKTDKRYSFNQADLSTFAALGEYTTLSQVKSY